LSTLQKIPYNKLKVLLVDPQRPFQIMMKGILANFGVKHIDTCDSGEAALRSCRSKEYHLLLVEYNLGSKNGTQLLEELRTLRLIKPNALFLIVSAETDRAIVLGTMEMAPDDYIIKPFSQRLLDSRMQKSWSKRQALSSIYQCLDRHDLPRAILACKVLIKEKNRYSAVILQMMTGLMCDQGQNQDAANILTPLLKERELPWANLNLARAQLGLNNIIEAEIILKSLIKSQSTNVAAIDLLAKLQLFNGQKDLAKTTLERSVELSPFSMKRHQFMVEVAAANHDYSLVKESYGKLLNLSRRSVHAGTNHLFNYTRSIIENVAHCEETKDIYKLQNELTSTLHRAKLEEGRNLDFPFSALEGVIQAQLQSAKGESLISKKTLMEAIHTFCDEDDNWDLPDELAPDACITLINLNDFELASVFAKQLNSESDIAKSLHARLNDDRVTMKKAEFSKVTRQGIEAYSSGDDLQALQLFKQALKLSPVNSGAVLNVARAQIKLMLDRKKYVKLLLSECKDSFRILAGMKLSKSHQKRFNKLRSEYEGLIKK
jgi:DNA-binding NarL/FixJ family response regulator